METWTAVSTNQGPVVGMPPHHALASTRTTWLCELKSQPGTVGVALVQASIGFTETLSGLSSWTTKRAQVEKRAIMEARGYSGNTSIHQY